ncbi:MAG: RagB/SusD family nutrient uptake outer membrane protein [Gemmatimonadetes bacterium]|nr:RagB/SusD family nutrient uptake outer membrane protein [Gemmatimonadota bacterium]
MRRRRRGTPVVAVAAFALLAGCDGLLEVEHPHLLTAGDLTNSANAEFQINSAIALFECGYSTFGWVALGHEDVAEYVSGFAAKAHVFRADPATGVCDTGFFPAQAWFDQFMGARAMLSNADGTGVYQRLQGEWSLGVQTERLSALAALYVAAALDHFGEYYCEITFDGGDLLTPDEVLALAEDWITNRALAHIANHGDFALPNGIATSAQTTAIALRARIRWARGDLAGAAADAATVPPGFTAWVTRESGAQRRNKIFDAATFGSPFSAMLGVNRAWNGATRKPNPVTGQLWPDSVPFTGYFFLGVMPDGRAVSDAGYPVRWAQEVRSPAPASAPVSLGNGAIPEVRTPHTFKSVSGPAPREVPNRFKSVADDIPLVDWKEMWLIRAEHAGGQAAIDLVNELRVASGMPLVTYITGASATAQQIRYMLIEERRREFFSQAGRYWSTKILNTDILWFPRGEGRTVSGVYALEGGVRLAMPTNEYLLNPHLVARGGLAVRGSGCDPAEAPVFP